MKITLAVLAVATLFLAAAILLSLIKLINTDLSSNRTFYHDQDVTLLTAGVFDIRNYDRVSISLRSKFDFNVTVCQAHCSEMSHLKYSVPLNYTSTVNITRPFSRREYIRMTNTSTGSLYMLKNSKVTFTVEIQGSENSSGVTLNIFSDVRGCDDFKDCPDCSSGVPHKTLTLNVSNSFAATHTVVAGTDEYICVVAEFMDYTVYTYSVDGLIYQYYNVSYLANQGLCVFNDSLTTHSGEVSLSWDHALERPLSSAIAINKQLTCLLVTLSSSSCPCLSNMLSWIIFATLKTPGVIATLAIGVIFFIAFLLLGLCIFCLIICK